MELTNDSKIELIVAVCNKCALLLKDPTEGSGAEKMPPDVRARAREDAYENLTICIDTLAAIATFNEGFFDVVNIASKLKLNVT